MPNILPAHHLLGEEDVSQRSEEDETTEMNQLCSQVFRPLPGTPQNYCQGTQVYLFSSSISLSRQKITTLTELANFNNKVEELKLSIQPKEGRQEANRLYQEMLDLDGGRENVTKMRLFCVLGTGRGAAYMLSHVDRDLGSKWEVFSKAHLLSSWWYKLATRRSASWVLGCVSMTLKTFLYLLDIAKDVTTIWILANMPTKPVLLISVTMASLAASELVKALHLSASQGDSMLRRVGYFLMSPFMPMFLNHQQCVLENQLVDLALKENRTEQQEAQMTMVRERLQDAMAMKGELRGVENILEHSLQIIVPLLVLNLPGYGLTDTDRDFFIISSCLSVASLVGGQLLVVTTRENSHLGIKAMLLLIVYLIIAVVPRGYLLYSGLLMALKETFHCSLEHCPFSNYISLVPLITILLVMLVHTGLSFAVQTRFFTAKKNRFVESLWTLLAPPLNMDWDKMFREPGCNMSISDCWANSKMVVLLHNLLTFGGNIAIGVALLICSHLKEDFDLTQIPALLVPAVVSPFFLLGLGYIYFVKCHLWSSLLNEEL